MNNRKFAKIFLTVALVLIAVFSMSACMNEADYYTRDSVDLLLTELRAELASNKTDLDSKITALKSDYETKIAALDGENEARKAEIVALTEAYNEKVATLEASNKANADALATLKTKYEADIARLEEIDSDNKSEIDALKADYTEKVTALETSSKENADALTTLKSEYEAKAIELSGLIDANTAKIIALEGELADEISAVEADYNAKINGINELILALQTTDKENVERIAALEKKVEELLAAHVHSFGAEWVDYKANGEINCEDRLLFRICEECGDLKWKVGREHDFDDSGCCTICKTILEYTVTFDSNGGTPIAPSKVVKNNLIAEPEAPTKEGFFFDGWFLEDSEAWSFETPVTADITLVAKWKAVYTVSFDSDGADPISPVTVGEGELLPRPEKPDKGEKYLFAGWLIAGAETHWDFEDMSVTEDVTLVADWILVLPMKPANPETADL